MADYSKKMARGGKLGRGKTPRKGVAQKPTGTIQDFIGILAGKTKKVATIEEMNEAAAQGWAGEVKIEGDTDA